MGCRGFARAGYCPGCPRRWSPGERFDYAPLPRTVECGRDKDRRAHLDVTAGCLEAQAIGAYTRGVARATDDGAFRAIALGHDGDDPRPVKWTAQAVEVRFFHRGPNGPGVAPGVKAFVRYRSEDDLYVASWRLDGIVQLQRKRCGTYTALAVRNDLAPPTPGAWHRLRLAADGARLTLDLDGQRALAVDDPTFSWGTAGIRVDGLDDLYLDDWVVEPP